MAKRNHRELGNNIQLGTMIRAQPFQPFDIKTAYGDTIHVIHPDFVARSPLGDTAIIYERDGHHRVVQLSMVVTLEPARAKGTPRSGRP